MRFFNSPIQVVDRVEFGHDGRQLIAAGTNVPDLRLEPDNRGLAIWDLLGGAEPVNHRYADHLVTGFAINPASDWLYLGTGYNYEGEDDSGYFAVKLGTGKTTRLDLRSGNDFTLAVHPSGRWLMVAAQRAGWSPLPQSGYQQLIRWQQPARRAPMREWELESHGLHTTLIACDPNGRRVVTHEIEQGQLVVNLVYQLRVRDSDTGKVREVVPVPGQAVEQLVFSPDGEWLVVRAGPSFLVWDAADFASKPRKVVGGRGGNFSDLAFHPSGHFLAATSSDQTVTLYDTTTWELAKTFTWDIGRMRSIAFSPDGMLAAAGSDSGKIVVWDVDL